MTARSDPAARVIAAVPGVNADDLRRVLRPGETYVGYMWLQGNFIRLTVSS